MSELDQEIPDLTEGGTPTTDWKLKVVDQDGNSRWKSLGDIAQYIKTAESIVPASEPFRGARVVLSSSVSISATGASAVPWGSADFDTDSIWSAGSPTRMVVPAGVSMVRITAGVRWASSDGGSQRYIYINRNANGAHDFPGIAISGGFPSNFSDGFTVSTGVVQVSEGDYFEAFVSHDHSGNDIDINDDPATFMCLEVVEVQPE